MSVPFAEDIAGLCVALTDVSLFNQIFVLDHNNA
ncbi:unnamed protein product [Cylicostephanus goldi]|uniref:Uncharacterized protein n=1 Tax=Cylicostephanus goldi TaxID=71465 RepID=A0A3P7NGT1_CYLGO|nr:unnamed protein product [Cylicostephanus goldi]